KQKMFMIEKLYTKEKLPDYYREIKRVIDYVDRHSPWEISKKEAAKYFRNIDTISIIPREVYKNNEEKIEEALAVFQGDYKKMDRTLARSQRARAREEIMNLTVNISRYLFANIESHLLRLNDYEQVFIGECGYNSCEGIIRPVLRKKSEIVEFSSHSF
ncbi:MAG: CRISPR-associated helicase/endonuclease Cas3, partial [Clostridiaceae bacterium]|nr:CRISPR-associated helicase/endonuclease Cas3 [Clostridiaceae bacterium]